MKKQFFNLQIATTSNGEIYLSYDKEIFSNTGTDTDTDYQLVNIKERYREITELHKYKKLEV